MGKKCTNDPQGSDFGIQFKQIRLVKTPRYLPKPLDRLRKRHTFLNATSFGESMNRIVVCTSCTRKLKIAATVTTPNIKCPHCGAVHRLATRKQETRSGQLEDVKSTPATPRLPPPIKKPEVAAVEETASQQSTNLSQWDELLQYVPPPIPVNSNQSPLVAPFEREPDEVERFLQKAGEQMDKDRAAEEKDKLDREVSREIVFWSGVILVVVGLLAGGMSIYWFSSGVDEWAQDLADDIRNRHANSPASSSNMKTRSYEGGTQRGKSNQSMQAQDTVAEPASRTKFEKAIRSAMAFAPGEAITLDDELRLLKPTIKTAAENDVFKLLEQVRDIQLDLNYIELQKEMRASWSQLKKELEGGFASMEELRRLNPQALEEPKMKAAADRLKASYAAAAVAEEVSKRGGMVLRINMQLGGAEESFNKLIGTKGAELASKYKIDINEESGVTFIAGAALRSVLSQGNDALIDSINGLLE